MNARLYPAAAAIAALTLSGCASTPKLSMNYYLPTTSASFKVVRTIACDEANNPIVATAVTPTVKHRADPALKQTVDVDRLRGSFSNTDLKFEYYEDGRLSGINASSTGQGEAILKTAITLATAIVGLDGGSPTYPDECAAIKKFGGGKPLTLTYDGQVDLAAAADVVQTIDPDTTSLYYAGELKAVLGPICAYALGGTTPAQPLSNVDEKAAVLFQMRQPGTAHVRILSGAGPACGKVTIWDDSLPAAQFGAPYTLPIPSPAVFGKQVFAASFAESGALKSVQYASDTSAGQVLNVGSAALTALQGDSDTQKAAAVKGQADLILQQQRLVACIADPASCK